MSELSAASSAALIQIMGGAWLSRAVAVAAKLGLADLVEDEPRTAGALAAAVGAHPDVLARLLRLLAACGLFSEGAEGVYSNAPLSALLRTDHPASLRHFCMLAGGNYTDAWGGLLHTVMTGESAYPHVFGGSIYDHMDRSPETARVYDLAMRDLARPVGALLARREEFASARHVIDVGGGDGTLLRPILAAHPDLAGVSADRADVCRRAAADVDPRYSERLSFCPTDFFVRVPEGDVHLLKNVLHNWSDDRCVDILSTIARSMTHDDGRLMILEPLLEPDDASPRKLMDALLQAVICEGGTRARSAADFRGIARNAGLAIDEVVPLPTGHALMICRRIS